MSTWTNNDEIYNTMVGVSNVEGATLDEKYAFFYACKDFLESKTWRQLKQTVKRQFGCTFPESIQNFDPNRDVQVYDTVEIQGLQGAKELNGRKGEILPNVSSSSSERFRVRLFKEGKFISVKKKNLKLIQGDDFIVKVLGGDGGNPGCGFYKTWNAVNVQNKHGPYAAPECAMMNPSHVTCTRGVYAVSCLFYDLEGEESQLKYLLDKDMKLAKRIKAPMAKPGKACSGFPFLCGHSTVPNQRVSREELRMLTASLLACSRFYKDLFKSPIPPKPYFLALDFQPLVQSYNIPVKLGKKKPSKNIQMQCSYPSGHLETPHIKSCSQPGGIRHYAARPRDCYTPAQAIIFHRNWIENVEKKRTTDWKLSFQRGDQVPYNHRFGLANALWESEIEENVYEAIKIAEELYGLWENDQVPDQVLRVFLLDLLLETGKWSKAAQLISKHQGDPNEPWLWNEAFITFQNRGPDSKLANKALINAMQFNRYVAPILLGEDMIDAGNMRSGTPTVNTTFTMNGKTYMTGHRQNAISYCFNFGKFWYCDPTSMDWLRKQMDDKKVKKKLEKNPGLKASNINNKAFTSNNETTDGNIDKTSNDSNCKSTSSHFFCAYCKNTEKKLMMCPCKEVYYCDASCQKKDWKVHKKVHKSKMKGKKSSSTKKKETKTNPKDDGKIYHPSWARLTPLQLQAIRSAHKNCNVPWPISQEMPAMINSSKPCFLQIHPNMIMQSETIVLPSFRMNYRKHEGSTVQGQMFPPNQIGLVIVEQVGSSTLVPVHIHCPKKLILIAEVIYTDQCRFQMEEFYGRHNLENRGRYFDWPAMIDACVGTGERVKTSHKRVHIMCAETIVGMVKMGDQEQHLIRLVPRILTLEGFEKIMGNSDDKRRFIATTGSKYKGQQLYPELLRKTCSKDLKKNMRPKKPITFNKGWELFHESGRYLAYERFVTMEGAANIPGPTIYRHLPEDKNFDTGESIDEQLIAHFGSASADQRDQMVEMLKSSGINKVSFM